MFQLLVVLAWINSFLLLCGGFGGTPLLGKFLRPDYWWIVKMGTGILVLFLFALVYCDPHNRGRRGIGLFLQMGIMIVPLLYLPTAVSSELSPEAARKRSFPTAGSGLAELDAAPRQDASGKVSTKGKAAPRDRELQEDPSLIRLIMESKSYDGKRVTTLGRVCLDHRLPGNTFFCYRLLMICCAADARPIGVLVHYDKIDTLQDGEWVKVAGTVGLTTFQEHSVVRIAADQVESATPPGDPYVWP
ncbi:MAG: TIGR03943 family protein [Pseudomonadota bacterium]